MMMTLIVVLGLKPTGANEWFVYHCKGINGSNISGLEFFNKMYFISSSAKLISTLLVNNSIM